MDGHSDCDDDTALTDADRLILAESYIDDRNKYVRRLETERAALRDMIEDAINDIQNPDCSRNDVKWRLKDRLANVGKESKGNQ